MLIANFNSLMMYQVIDHQNYFLEIRMDIQVHYSYSSTKEYYESWFLSVNVTTCMFLDFSKYILFLKEQYRLSKLKIIISNNTYSHNLYMVHEKVWIVQVYIIFSLKFI